MKTFFVSVAIFFIVLSIVILNAFYMNNFSKEINTLVYSLSETLNDADTESAEALNNYFSKNEKLLMLTNNHSKVEEIKRLILRLNASIKSNEIDEYIQIKSAIPLAAEDICKYSNITFDSIF